MRRVWQSSVEANRMKANSAAVSIAKATLWLPSAQTFLLRNKVPDARSQIVHQLQNHLHTDKAVDLVELYPELSLGYRRQGWRSVALLVMAY